MFHTINRSFPLFLCICLGEIPFSGHAYGMFSETSEALGVYEKAIHVSPLVKTIHEDGLERRQLEAGQLKELLSSITENDTKDPEQLRKSVIQSLENDKMAFEVVNQRLQSGTYKAGEKGTTFQLLNNRMPIITAAALQLAQEENIFFDLLEGKLPQGYSIEPPEFNYFPESDHIFSHGRRGNPLKSLLLKIWQIQNDKSSLSETTQLFEPSWLDTSPFVHITPLPEDFDVTSLQTFPHFYSDTETPKALLTIHNGYAFGGHRNETRYPNGKKWGPHDCSSFVAMYTNCEITFSTLHQAKYFQDINGFQFGHLGEDIVAQWNATKNQRQQDTYLQAMSRVLDPLKPNPDPNSINPGVVHAERNYTNISTKPEVALSGTGGHTGVFLGTIGSAGETRALTITAARDLENSGKEFIFGVEPRPFFSTPERMIMFFDVKQ